MCTFQVQILANMSNITQKLLLLFCMNCKKKKKKEKEKKIVEKNIAFTFSYIKYLNEKFPLLQRGIK